MKILKSPKIIILSIIVGILIGIKYKALAKVLLPFGEIYISLLQMCVIPILITAIISSFGKLISNNQAKKYLKKLFMYFIIFTMSISVIGVIIGYIGIENMVSKEDKIALGKVVQSDSFDLTVSLKTEVFYEEKNPIVEFFKNLIPSNIFVSLGNGITLQILFFSVILGIAIGYNNTEDSKTYIRYMHLLFHSFQKIIAWAMYLLPIGLVCLLSGKIASVGTEILFAMINFIILFYLAGIIISIINFIIIWKTSKSSLKKSLEGITEPSIFALTTVNSFACLPPLIEKLLSVFKYKESTVNLVTPIGITLGRYGNVLFFTLAAIFISAIYNIEITFIDIIIIILASSLAALSTAGATGIVTLTMLTIVLKPLGLPSETAIIIFLAADPIIDPMRTLLIVNTNMTISALIAEKETKHEIKAKW